MEYTETEANYYHDIGGAIILLTLTSFASAIMGNNYYLISGFGLLGFIIYAIGIYTKKNLPKKRK